MPRCFQHGAILFSILLFGFKIVSSLPWTSTTCDYENILGVCVPCTLEKRNGYLFRKLDKGIAPERPKSVKIRAFGRNKTTDGSKVEGFAVIIEHPNDKGLLNGYLISIKRTREVLSGEAVTVNKKDFLVQLTELQRKDLPLKVEIPLTEIHSRSNQGDPYIWMGYSFQIITCSLPAESDIDKGNCYRTAYIHNPAKLPDVENYRGSTSPSCTAERTSTQRVAASGYKIQANKESSQENIDQEAQKSDVFEQRQLENLYILIASTAAIAVLMFGLSVIGFLIALKFYGVCQQSGYLSKQRIDVGSLEVGPRHNLGDGMEWDVQDIWSSGLNIQNSLGVTNFNSGSRDDNWSSSSFKQSSMDSLWFSSLQIDSQYMEN